MWKRKRWNFRASASTEKGPLSPLLLPASTSTSLAEISIKIVQPTPTSQLIQTPLFLHKIVFLVYNECNMGFSSLLNYLEYQLLIFINFFVAETKQSIFLTVKLQNCFPFLFFSNNFSQILISLLTTHFLEINTNGT